MRLETAPTEWDQVNWVLGIMVGNYYTGSISESQLTETVLSCVPNED